jgi:inosine/xanthosine triphosphate pyrophosphatase family protein
VAVVALASHGKIAGTFGVRRKALLASRAPTASVDPFFFPDLHLTFAQMLPAVKRRVSHRGKALAQPATSCARGSP